MVGDRVEPQHRHPAGVRSAEALERLDGGGLARTVRSEHRGDLPGGRLEADAVDRGDVAVAHHQARRPPPLPRPRTLTTARECPKAGGSAGGGEGLAEGGEGLVDLVSVTTSGGIQRMASPKVPAFMRMRRPSSRQCLVSRGTRAGSASSQATMRPGPRTSVMPPSSAASDTQPGAQLLAARVHGIEEARAR